MIAYITKKRFTDGSEEIRIKHNQEITLSTIENIQKSKKINQIKKEINIDYLKKQIAELKFTDINYFKKLRRLNNELKIRNIKNVCRSARRSRQNLYDVCRCNEFSYFVTYTFDNDKIERLNDDLVKRKFTQLQNYLRKKFPCMYYVAVPEYHKKGGLHFHLLIGGVTLDELGAVPAVSKRKRLIFKNGKQIFNITKWKYGYSTLSVIGNCEATKHYISKYITKQHLDDRFINKRRYYCSKNIVRPQIEKYTCLPERCLDDVDLNVYTVAYADRKKLFAVLTSDGNGVVDFSRNTDEVKEHMQDFLRNEHACRRASAVAKSVPYLTIGTLDSTNYLLSRNYSENDKPKLVDYSEELRELGFID